MALSIIKNRRLKPNWRSPYFTLLNGEMEGTGIVKVPNQQVSIEGYAQDWISNRSVAYAGELIASGVTNGESNNPIVLDAAEWVVEHSRLDSSSPLYELSQVILQDKKIDSHSAVTSDAITFESYNEEINKHIHLLRLSVNEAPRNAYRHVELARAYLLKGEHKKALLHISIAAQLAPDNRYVTRSAVRCELHYGDYDRAKYLLSRNRRLKSDPWLLATDISVDLIRGKSPRLFKQAKNILDSNSFSPQAITEMAIALAVLENNNGAKNKKIRSLIKIALKDPIDNSVAQAKWLNHVNPVLNMEIGEFGDLKFNYEVETYNKMSENKYKSAYEYAVRWLKDSAFSHRAAITASNIAAMYLNKIDDSIKILKIGLTANPKSPNLLNNLAYQLLVADKVEEAENELRKVDYRAVEYGETSICLKATNGLLCFRKKEYDKGIALYQEAIHNAKKNRDISHMRIAELNLKYEQYKAELITKEEALHAISTLKGGNDSWVNVQIDSIEQKILSSK